MTKLPADTWTVVGVEGPPFKVGPYCNAPGCHRVAEHAHHIWRRSFLGGDYKWVEIDGEEVVANLTALCAKHHQLITENVAEIEWDGKLFWWVNEGERTFPLSQQPPSFEALLDGKQDQPSSRLICSECGRPLPKPKIETPPEETKPRATWAVSVPVDERENGYQVLEELLEGCREKLDTHGLHYDHGHKVKYYPLATTLALFLQHADTILADL